MDFCNTNFISVFIILFFALSAPDINDDNMRDGNSLFRGKNYTIVDGRYSTNVLFGKFALQKYVVPMSDRGSFLGFAFIILMLGLMITLVIHIEKKIKNNIYKIRADKLIKREIHELVLQKRKYADIRYEMNLF